MTRLRCIFTLCVLAAAVATTAAQEKPAIKVNGGSRTVDTEIRQLEQAFSDAEVNADIARMSELLADDWTDIEDDGHIYAKVDVIKLFQSPTTKLGRDVISELSVRQYGDTAVVTLLDSAEFTVEGRDMGGVFRITDVWVKHEGKWRMVALHSSKFKK